MIILTLDIRELIMLTANQEWTWDYNWVEVKYMFGFIMLWLFHVLFDCPLHDMPEVDVFYIEVW